MGSSTTFCKTSLDNFGADSGDLDRSLYNLSMITRLFLRFASGSKPSFSPLRVMKHARGLITYLTLRTRGHSVEDTTPLSGGRETPLSEWRIIKSQHRCARNPLPRAGRHGPPGEGEGRTSKNKHC